MDPDTKKYLASIRDFSSLGLEMGLGLVLGVYLGHVVDKNFHTDPWGVLVGCVLGLGAAASSFYKAYKRLKKIDNSTDEP